MLPPTYKLPAMYAPPFVTCSAPVLTPVFGVELVKETVPLALKVVNAPVPAVILPIATACKPPALAVVNVAVPGVTLPIATACKPPKVDV